MIQQVYVFARWVLIIIACQYPVSLAVADIVVCEYERHEGEIVQERPSYIVMKVGRGYKGISRKDIIEIIYIDADGSVIKPKPEFDDYSEGMAAVKIRGKWGYVDENEKVVIGPRFDKASLFCEGLARVAEAKRWGFINTEGEFVIYPQYEETQDFNEDLAAIKVEGKWGYIARDGRPVISCRFDAASIFSDGKAWVKYGEKEMYIDKKGEPIKKDEQSL